MRINRPIFYVCDWSFKMHFFPACGCLNNGCNSAGASFASPNKDHALPFPHPRCRSSLLYLRRRKRQVQESDFQTSALFATEQNPLCSYLSFIFIYGISRSIVGGFGWQFVVFSLPKCPFQLGSPQTTNHSGRCSSRAALNQTRQP